MYPLELMVLFERGGGVAGSGESSDVSDVDGDKVGVEVVLSDS